MRKLFYVNLLYWIYQEIPLVTEPLHFHAWILLSSLSVLLVAGSSIFCKTSSSSFGVFLPLILFTGILFLSSTKIFKPNSKEKIICQKK